MKLNKLTPKQRRAVVAAIYKHYPKGGANGVRKATGIDVDKDSVSGLANRMKVRFDSAFRALPTSNVDSLNHATRVPPTAEEIDARRGIARLDHPENECGCQRPNCTAHLPAAEAIRAGWTGVVTCEHCNQYYGVCPQCQLKDNDEIPNGWLAHALRDCRR